MIFDILQIFPNAFPQSLIETVYKISYIDDERDKIYTYLVDTDISISDNIDNLLCKYIDENWNKRQMNNLYKKSGESFSLVTGKNKIACDLSCSICIKSISEGLKIIFKVSNDDFCVSEIGDYNTLASDGVHLLLCGTEEYSYNSIFFFPKEIDGEIKVIVCDVFNYRNKVLDDDLINAKILKTENDYTITVILSNVFLEENHLSSYFYMGVVISDCSSETHSRKNALILSEETSQWYNHIYFAKVVIN